MSGSILIQFKNSAFLRASLSKYDETLSKYKKVEKWMFFLNFLLLMNRSDGGLSDMQRALRR